MITTHKTICPYCGSSKVYYRQDATIWECLKCSKWFDVKTEKEIIMKKNFKLEMYVQDIDEEIMKEIINIIECKASEAGAQAGGGYSEDPYDEDYQSSPEDFEEPELTTNNVETLKEILETIKDIRKSMEDLFPEVGNVQE